MKLYSLDDLSYKVHDVLVPFKYLSMYNSRVIFMHHIADIIPMTPQAPRKDNCFVPPRVLPSSHHICLRQPLQVFCHTRGKVRVKGEALDSIPHFCISSRGVRSDVIVFIIILRQCIKNNFL